MRSPLPHRPLLVLATTLALLAVGATSRAAPTAKGTYRRIEASFELPALTGNPFDYTENDVQVAFQRPDGSKAAVPAFFDGDGAWRVRYTPDAPGHYVVQEITRNGHAIEAKKLDRREFDVSGDPSPGFVRISPDKKRFVFDNGEPYYPLGCDVGWGDRKMTADRYLTRLGELGGINWSRIWMSHFDNGNLDWARDKKLPVGDISLTAARNWDSKVEAAERQGIHFQMVLQHHGQYTLPRGADSNWRTHPWSKTNGGWLNTPAEFFTDAKAIKLTKAKYRYIVARYSYSPAVMAWELFNEVQYTEGATKHPETVTRWHSDMAAFLRQHDPYHHLVTTSSDPKLDIWGDMDYYQVHTYRSDPIAGVAAKVAIKVDKPIFIGEMGPAGSIGLHKDDGRAIHPIVWAGILSPMPGGAQYWEWETVEQFNLYPHLRAGTAFVKASRMAAATDLQTLKVAVETPQRGALCFAPVADWTAENRQTEVTVQPNGDLPGLIQMQEMLHGRGHREFPNVYTFHVDYAQPGVFKVRIATAARNGAKLALSVDGTEAAQHEFPRAKRDTRTDVVLEAKVPAGKHVVTLANSGTDWVLIDQIELPDYAPALGVLGKSNGDYAVFWVYRRAGIPPEVSGTLVVPGLAAGEYTATWWDTYEGKELAKSRVDVKAGQPLRLTTPPIARDAAVWITR